jgi:DNA-binding XRE family transcriptional regulator
MKRSFYRERDYAFGQTFLTLRTTIGLTQAELAQRLGISRKAVGEWEAGETYPTAEHLKAVIALAVGHQVWPSGREEEETARCGRRLTRRCCLMKPGLARCCPMRRRQEHQSQATRPVELPRLLQGGGLAWIGATHWP